MPAVLAFIRHYRTVAMFYRIQAERKSTILIAIFRQVNVQFVFVVMQQTQLARLPQTENCNQHCTFTFRLDAACSISIIISLFKKNQNR